MLLLLLLGFFALATASPRSVLNSHINADGLVRADDDLLDLAFNGARDFNVLMLLTGEGSGIACDFCDVLGPNFKTVAKSYAQSLESEEERGLYFVVADFQTSMANFRKLGLQQIPNVALFPPTKSRSDGKLGIQGKHMFMSFKSNGDQEQALLELLRGIGFEVKIKKPFPTLKLVKLAATLVLVAAGGFLLRAQVLRVWQAKQIWLALSLMAVVMFISGHMFNVTRGTPFMGHNGKQPQLIEHSFNTQFAVETQIVAVVYAVLAFTTIGLIKFVPRIPNVRHQTAGAVFGAIAILAVYSVFLNLFSDKMGGYRFTLLPLSLF